MIEPGVTVGDCSAQSPGGWSCCLPGGHDGNHVGTTEKFGRLYQWAELSKAGTNALENLIEMLEAWLTFHRQSPLDGTISCKICAAMVLEENSERHADWHRDIRND